MESYFVDQEKISSRLFLSNQNDIYSGTKTTKCQDIQVEKTPEASLKLHYKHLNNY